MNSLKECLNINLSFLSIFLFYKDPPNAVFVIRNVPVVQRPERILHLAPRVLQPSRLSVQPSLPWTHGPL